MHERVERTKMSHLYDRIVRYQQTTQDLLHISARQIHANVLSETDGGCSSREKYRCSRINRIKLLSGLATSVSAAELHGSGARSGVGGLVSALATSSTTVGSAVSLALLALASTNKNIRISFQVSTGIYIMQNTRVGGGGIASRGKK